MSADDELVRRLNAELDAWEQRPDAARWRPTPPPPDVDLEALAAWAQQSLEATRAAFLQLAAAVQPVAARLAELQRQLDQAAVVPVVHHPTPAQQAHAVRRAPRRQAVPFYAVQPNRSRRRR